MAAVPETEHVVHAVEHLHELGNRMLSAEFGFHDDDVSNIDKIIESIHELEAERQKSHELLETQTITASVLRHKLQFYPTEIRKEIQSAVQSARNANADQLQKLQGNLDTMFKNIEYLTNRHAQLEKENSDLLPERDHIRREHEQIIGQLNQRMAEKAAKQIQLNETRDKLRETNQMIVNIEEDIVQLKEDLIQERAEARVEKKRLKNEVNTTFETTKEQKAINIEKQKEVDHLDDKVKGSEADLANLKRSIREYTTSRSRLEGQERAMTSQLKRQIQVNQGLRRKGLDIANENTKLTLAYRQRRASLEEKQQDLIGRIEYEEGRVDGLQAERTKLQSEAKEAIKKRKVDEQKVAEMNQLLQQVKGELGKNGGEFGRLDQENLDCEEKIAKLAESHKSIVAMLTKQIEDYRESLNKERKERMDLQGRRDSVQKDLDDLRVEQQRFLAEKNKEINQNKAKHQELQQEGSSLQKSIKDNNEMIERLKQQVEKAEREFSSMQTSMQQKISSMQEEISRMEKDVKEKEKMVDEKTPGYEELERDFEIRTKEYDQMKKEIVGLKNKKLGLEDATKRSKTTIEKFVKPTESLRIDLKKRRDESLSQMKMQAQDVRQVEQNIYNIGCKLKTVLDENQRFQMANVDLEHKLLDVHKDMDDNEDLRETLQGNIQQLKGTLENSWQQDNELEKKFAARDEAMVDELSAILKKTEKREHFLGSVHDRLDGELLMLASFLENVSSRRPKESRESKRTPTASRGSQRLASRISTHRKSDALSKVTETTTQQSTKS